jgi:hypothetical protein
LAPVSLPFDGFREKTVGVSGTCLVRFDCNRYSVDSRAAGKSVQLRAYADRIVVRLDGEIVAQHQRSFGRYGTFTNFLHYIPVVERKPGALRNGLPFADALLPPDLSAVRARLGRTNEADRQFAGILAAIPTDGLEAVEQACRLSLDQGVCSKDVILTLLARGRDTPPPPLLETAPKLTIPPVADCARYDRLRPSAREIVGVIPVAMDPGHPPALEAAHVIP